MMQTYGNKIRRIILLDLFLVLISTMPVWGQDNDHVIYRRVKVVYDNIARAFGDGRPPPRLLLVPAEQDKGIAARTENLTEAGGEFGQDSDSRQEASIIISKRAISALATLGDDMDNGLAFLLGHELAHFYLRHGWVAQFGHSYNSLDVGKTMKKTASMEDIVKVETEADYFGGFYGHLAGYDAFDTAPKVLDLIYSTYRYPEQIPNYPSLMERKLIAQNTVSHLRKLIPIFEAANLLMLTEQYKPAARLFEYIGRTFPSREIHNNTGVAYALEAMRLYKPGTLSFVYPFEVDTETRLRQPHGKLRSPASPDSEEGRHLLMRSADAFDAAVKQDRSYAAAYINLASVISLLGDNDTALVHVNRAMELARRQNENTVLADALIVRGIMYAAIGNRERAMVDFAAARNYGTPFAAINLAILRGEKLPPHRHNNEIRTMQTEKIGGVSAHAPFSKKESEVAFSLRSAVEADPLITIRSAHHGGWMASRIIVGNKRTSAVYALKNYVGNTARGIRIGASNGDIRRAYGVAGLAIASRQGFYNVYSSTGIIFHLDSSESLIGWVIYDLQ